MRVCPEGTSFTQPCMDFLIAAVVYSTYPVRQEQDRSHNPGRPIRETRRRLIQLLL
jgi:hypothetical protein